MATVEGTKGVSQLRGYLMENSFGLRDYRLEIGGGDLKSSLGISSAGIDSWSWRLNLMVSRDSHRSRIDSYQFLPDLTILTATFYNAREFEFVSHSNVSLQNLVFFILV